jgi:hypothetical protein
MYTLRCPHCENDIELLGQSDLTELYALTPNKVVRLLGLESMPAPVLSFGNRRLWTRQQIEEFRAREGQERVQMLLHDIESSLEGLPPEQRALFRQALLAETQEPENAKK